MSRRFARGLDAGGGVRVARAAVDIGAMHLPREIVAAYPPAARGSESTTVEAQTVRLTLRSSIRARRQPPPACAPAIASSRSTPRPSE
ncbi:MAG TPA: hypothetical protein VIW69_17695 [Candidatus Elarobacter sp.]